MGNLLDELVNLQDRRSEMVLLKDIQSETMHESVVGELVSVKKTGHILVDYPSNPSGPLSARSTVSITREDKNRNVLLVFEKNDPQFPIIIGFIQEQAVVQPEEIVLDKDKVRDVIVDGERIVFDANKEIELRCGSSSIIMKKNGKMVIKGTQLVSRASKINRIKGAAVKIN